MAHNHSHEAHHHSHSASEKRLGVSIALNLIITISQIVGGIISNSLSLISDSVHNLTDTFSMVISLFSIKLSHKKSDEKKTFGYKRAEIIAAFINTTVLVGVSLFLFKEAFGRLINPENINGKVMFIVAIVGLLGNAISAALLFKDSKESVNIKSTFLHIFSDALSSIAVIIGGVLITYKGWYIIDPILTFAIGLYVLIASYNVFKYTIHILMQGAPETISIEEIKEDLERLEHVKNVHHIHLWSLDESDIFFDAHICVDEIEMDKIEELKEQIKDILHEEFSISHATLEFEINKCSEIGSH